MADRAGQSAPAAFAGPLGIAHTTRAKEDPELKRSLALLLTSVLLVFSLAACGKDQQPGGVDDSASNGSVTGGAGSGGLTDDSVTGGVNDGKGGGMMDDAMDTMDDVGDAARSAVRDAGDALTGGTTGYTKNQMNGYT